MGHAQARQIDDAPLPQKILVACLRFCPKLRSALAMLANALTSGTAASAKCTQALARNLADVMGMRVSQYVLVHQVLRSCTFLTRELVNFATSPRGIHLVPDPRHKCFLSCQRICRSFTLKGRRAATHRDHNPMAPRLLPSLSNAFQIPPQEPLHYRRRPRLLLQRRHLRWHPRGLHPQVGQRCKCTRL